MSAATGSRPQTGVAVARLIRWLEAGTAPLELFAPDERTTIRPGLRASRAVLPCRLDHF